MKRHISSWSLLILLQLLLQTALQAYFYYPDSRDYGNPSQFGYQYDEVSFESIDGTTLLGWQIKTTAKQREGVIIHFHGNAQNMSSHFRGVVWLCDQGYDVFTFDYRGYGKSSGRPERIGVYEDCVSAIRNAQRLYPEEQTFIVYGQSLGAANAIAVMGGEDFKHIKAIIAEAPFYSYRSIARDKVNLLIDPLVGFVISNEKSPDDAIANIAPTPLLLIHGTADQVVPLKHSEKLFQKAKAPKFLWKVPNARHLGVFNASQRANREKLAAFLGGLNGPSVD